ncbi:hypothetical protein KC349_g16 [Hortaea werneckii]|nr:hypothetical protein KC349_g16 [Hortaea werneckii]
MKIRRESSRVITCHFTADNRTTSPIGIPYMTAMAKHCVNDSTHVSWLGFRHQTTVSSFRYPDRKIAVRVPNSPHPLARQSDVSNRSVKRAISQAGLPFLGELAL